MYFSISSTFTNCTVSHVSSYCVQVAHKVADSNDGALLYFLVDILFLETLINDIGKGWDEGLIFLRVKRYQASQASCRIKTFRDGPEVVVIDSLQDDFLYLTQVLLVR